MIKPYINRKTGNATCDGVALSRIAKKKVPGSYEARMIMKMRKYGKLVSTYFNVNVDDDSRLRCAHKICGTVSGRISTEATFFGTGANLQNQPYIFKHYLIADEGYLLVEGDLAKAEAHCVAFLCQDANMIEAFESGVDVHSFNASKIFNIALTEVTKTQRQMGKKVVHASNYSMGPQTFSDNLAKEEVYMSMGECRKLLKAYQARFPGLTRWQRDIDKAVSSTRMLYNMFGRPKRFLGMLDTATFRNAYSYIPQSTVAELLNKGMINIYHDPWFDEYDMMLLATVHDSVLVQINKIHAEQLPEILNRIEMHMMHVFIHKGREFTIGFDHCIGKTWASKIELDNTKPETISAAVEELS
ncbi:MAG: DNA polymerase, partial [Dehalococcoidia bacterium]